MFSKTDDMLIFLFQWAVRQIELFTPLTRKKMLSTIITALFLVQLYLTFFHLLRLNILFFILVIAPFNGQTASLFIASRMQERAGTLPRAINERRYARFVLLGLIAIVGIGFLLPGLLDLVFIKGKYWDVSIFLVIHFLPIIFCFLAEYMLCTSSLPPGEKAKKQAKHEARNMLPQGI